MTNYDEEETSWTTLTLVFTIIIATLGYRFFGPDREAPKEKEPIKVPETKATDKQKEQESKEETAEIPEVAARVPVLESSPKISTSETINEEKEESNSTGSSEFERISNSEANDMPEENEEPDDEQVAEERIETPPVEHVEPKVEMEETRFLSFVDTTLEGQGEPEKEEYSPVTPDEESCVAESPESEDSKMSMHVNFDSEDIVKTIDIVHDDDEAVLEASKSDEELPGHPEVAPEQVVDPIPPVAVAQTTVTETILAEEPSRSNSPSIRTEPSDDEDPLEELKSSSPILVSDQDVELVKKELEKTESIEETERAINNEKKKEGEAVTEDAFIDTEEDIVKTIDIAKVDAAIDTLMGGAPILSNEETKLEQEKPTVPSSEPAVESEQPAAVEKEIDESLTDLGEYVPEESIVKETVQANSTLELLNSEKIDSTTAADESLSGLEMSLPDLECTAVGDEIQEGKWADNTILSNAGDARTGDLKAAAEDDVSEQEIKNAQLKEINKLLEEHNMLGDDVKVDDQVKMYTG